MLPVLAKLSPDLVIFEGMNVGAGIAANVLGIPTVAFSIGMAQGLIEFIDAAALGYHREAWTSRDRPTPAESSSFAGRLIDPTPPSLLEFSGGEHTSRIPIRPVAYGDTGGSLPSWLAGPAARPRVYLTLGTVSFGAVDVLQRAITEIAALDLDVLVAVGPDGDPAAFAPSRPMCTSRDSLRRHRFSDWSTWSSTMAGTAPCSARSPPAFHS